MSDVYETYEEYEHGDPASPIRTIGRFVRDGVEVCRIEYPNEYNEDIMDEVESAATLLGFTLKHSNNADSDYGFKKD
ncbi:MAG: hypothetical protein AB2792_23090 [Candidatus Thiodiazotropha sp.]